MRKIDGSVTAAVGFKASGVRCGIKQEGPDLAVICSDTDCAAAGVFTTNKFKGAPVIANIETLKSGKGRAIVANSGNANACTGERGLKDVQRMCELVGQAAGVSPDLVYAASTGIIGVPLPMDKLEKGIAEACHALSETGGDSASRAIMTTDTFAKTSAYEVQIGGKPVRIGGICKGSGMIHPSMATMLCFITTDADIDAPVLQKCLEPNVARTFNRVTVDGDTSTSDMVIVFANGQSGCPKIAEGTDAYNIFARALGQICLDLARDIARDGEGATKFVEIHVKNAASQADADTAAMTIANSPLVKTAIFGEDPNWGRVLAAAGRSGAEVVPEKTSLWFGDLKLVENGEPLAVDAETARKPMLGKDLVVTVDLGVGDAAAAAFTCDLSYDYVKINAEYHT